MLNAIIHSKAGRVNFDKESGSLSWRELYQSREDLLTAAFFSRFTYLSGLLQHRLLKSWLGGVGDFTEFKSIDYWPQYDLKNNPDRKFVEPDLLIRFESCDVLVEVKPPEGGDQYLDQWQLEIEGYYQQEDHIKALYFLAIGRVGSVLHQLDIEVLQKNGRDFKQAHSIEWKPIVYELSGFIKSGELDAQDQRIVHDMIKAVELYGVRAQNLRWDDLYPLSNSLGSLTCLNKLNNKSEK
tara:strand:- start:1060 stop:1776 length:717 start_codon:yes stop_codon:yes gene_type:complete